jgi:hypothetical protein
MCNGLLQAVELVHKFEEEPLAVALHPSGLYALIAFAERAKLCAILMGTLFTTHTFHVAHSHITAVVIGEQ